MPQILLEMINLIPNQHLRPRPLKRVGGDQLCTRHVYGITLRKLKDVIPKSLDASVIIAIRTVCEADGLWAHLNTQCKEYTYKSEDKKQKVLSCMSERMIVRLKVAVEVTNVNLAEKHVEQL